MEREQGGGASRSTDPAYGSSTATDVSLREHLTSVINAFERRSDERFEEMKRMVDTAFSNAQVAINKADAATEKRFESVNEFRATLTDQAGQFATREVLDALADKLSAQIDRNRQDLDALAKRLDLREGQTAGSRFTVGIVVTCITVGIALIGVVIVLANLATGK